MLLKLLVVSSPSKPLGIMQEFFLIPLKSLKLPHLTAVPPVLLPALPKSHTLTHRALQHPSKFSAETLIASPPPSKEPLSLCPNRWALESCTGAVVCIPFIADFNSIFAFYSNLGTLPSVDHHLPLSDHQARQCVESFALDFGRKTEHKRFLSFLSYASKRVCPVWTLLKKYYF